MKKAFVAEKIFTGTDVLHNHAIITHNKLITAIIPAVSVDARIEKIIYEDAFICPALIDLQIYGAEGALLSEKPSVETLEKMYQHCFRNATPYFLPTIASGNNAVLKLSVAAIKNYWDNGGKGVLGLHMEGPWINVEKAGAHNTTRIKDINLHSVQEVLDIGRNVIKMVTLAPELANKEIYDLLRENDIVVSAGHSNAGFSRSMTAFNEGVSCITHLYNAMAPFHHREPGIIGAAFHHPTVKASIIADGFHVSFETIKIAKKIMAERLFAITDAVTSSKGDYPHELKTTHYEINGTLSGSALTMPQALKNLHLHADISLDEAIRMCSLYPAKILNKQDELGLLKRNYPAEFVVISNSFEMVETVSF